MAEQDIIHVRGEGGAIWRMALPLPKDIQRRLDKGEISRVNADGSSYRATRTSTPAPAEVPDADPADSGPRTPGRPAQAAPKSAWIDYIARQGLLSRDDAAAYTKDDLIAMVS